MGDGKDDKNKGGRPLSYQTKEELEAAIDLYFDDNDHPTLAGLAYHLGISRSTLYEYAEGKFSDIIKKARERVESAYEDRLIYSGQPTGVIFALKNMGWKDKTETGFTDNQGNDITPVQIIQLPNNHRSKDDSSLPAPEPHG